MKCERGGKSMELEHQPQQKLIYQMISIGIHLKLAVFLCLMSFYHFCSWCDGNKGSWWDLGTGHFEECFSSACDVCLLLRGWQLGHRLFNADSLDFPRIDTSEYPFRLCGEWMKVVYCIPSKVTVYPAIYRSCISLQGLVQGKVRDCPLNYDLVSLWYTRECEKWVVIVSFYSMTSCCISLYSYRWGTNQGQVKVPPLVWVALFTSSTGRGIGMLQSALELVSGESLSPTQCTVGNFFFSNQWCHPDLSPCIHTWDSCIPLFKRRLLVP